MTPRHQVTPIREAISRHTCGRRPSSKPGRRRKRKSFVRRHKILLSLGVVLMLTLTTACGYLYWLNHQLDNIAKVDAGIDDRPRQARRQGEGQAAQHPAARGRQRQSDSESVEEDLEGRQVDAVHPPQRHA